MKKAVIILIVIGALVALVVVGRGRSNVETVEVEVETVEPRTIISVVEASGQIEPAVSVDISSDVIGRITGLGAEEGERVEKGQFLIQIDPTQLLQRVSRLEAELATSETTLEESQANLVIRKSDFDRDKRLYEQELVPQSQYESTEAAFRAMQAQVASARNRIRQSEAGLAEAQDQLNRCRIESPMDGIIIRKNAEVGEVAISGTLNNQGSLLMTIADMSVLMTEVDVDETDVVHVELGQEVEISLDAFPDREFKGEVTRIGNSAIQTSTAPGQRQSADYKVEVTLLEADSKIRPGLSATARITTAREEDALGVPIQALVIRDLKKDGDDTAGGSGVAMAASPDGEADMEEADSDDAGESDKKDIEGVFIIRDGKAVFMPVTTGIAGEQHFQVLEGLKAGEQVISGNFTALRKLKDGDAVEIKESVEEDGEKT